MAKSFNLPMDFVKKKNYNLGKLDKTWLPRVGLVLSVWGGRGND